ncbi:MAG: EAL domain-containing protein [Clostridiales bacterium]|nr:EAL domain-containing protein [Clostridiales bacterium]
MRASSIVSMLFFSVSAILFVSGLFTLDSNRRAPANRLFFALTSSITIWSCGMALSTIAADTVSSELWRRFSAVGWGSAYAFFLHFILIITDNSILRKWWDYSLLYLPAFITIFAFAIPNRLNPIPYVMNQTAYGWINVAQHNAWDWIFYIYYIGYTFTGLFLLYQWSRKTSDRQKRKNAYIVFFSIVAALIVGTFTDVILSSSFSNIPQVAPIIMLVPILSMYHVLQKGSLNISEGIDKKTSYLTLSISVLLYVILSAIQVTSPEKRDGLSQIPISEPVLRGIVVQTQNFISIYLALKENKPGYITSVVLNVFSLVGAVVFFVKTKLATPIPGIVSYIGVLIIVTLIKDYREKNSTYVKTINTQAVRERFFYNVFERAPVGIAIFRGTEFMIDEEFNDSNINPEYQRIVGRTKDELQSTDWVSITHPDDLEKDKKYFDQFVNGEMDSYSHEKRYIKPDGSEIWANVYISRFDGFGNNPADHISIIMDITERKQMEETLKYNNEHILLTGLYNRNVLEKVLNEDMNVPCGNRALVCVNLSGVYTLRLRYGYQYGQSMLKDISASLRSLCKSNYRLYNTTEYQFVYYLRGYDGEAELDDLCEKITDTVSTFLDVHGIGATVGILLIDESQPKDADTLLGKLMNTSEMAIKRGDSKPLYYSPDLDNQLARENEISQEITEIIEGTKVERLYMMFQPIIDIKLKKVCGFEALARLNSDKHGMVPPWEFISLAEKTNTINQLGKRIIALSLSFLKRLKQEGHNDISVSINISVIQILKPSFVSVLVEMINEMDLDPNRVSIELTESVFAAEITELNKVLNELRNIGVRIEIDDFGIGYSSFGRERDLNIDCMKIDRSFIERLSHLKPDQAITGDIIAMAHKLKQCVVAEGVEHKMQLDYLRIHNCDKVQGYLFSKPLSEDEALEFLVNQEDMLSVLLRDDET